jgi:hypothetical protein
MKTNIALLRGNVAAPALQASQTNNHEQDTRSEKNRDLKVSRAQSCPALQMIWRVHPTSGRLECRWAVDGGALSDEGVSCTTLFRQAA